jgi:phosphopantothenoylcysteine decarboxylase/phosphopantothenate--cysteine ligase
MAVTPTPPDAPLRFLISAGPTREYFDSVRFISNPSSGKMGYAIARAAVRRGHRVTLVSGPVALDPLAGVDIVRVESAAEMAGACKRVWRGVDVGVMTAAVCDYRPQVRLKQKLEKKAQPRRIMLEPTEDIAAALGRRKGRRLLIGFAMQDHDPYRLAERKLRSKNCDLIVLNGPENVGGDRAVISWFTPRDGWSTPFQGSKAAVATRLVKLIEAAWTGRDAS